MKIIIIASLLLSLNLKAQEEDVCSYLFESKSWKDEILPAQEEIKNAYHVGYHIRTFEKSKKQLLRSYRTCKRPMLLNFFL